MNTLEIYAALIRLGVTLELRGDQVVLRPASAVPPELLEMAIRHKAELIGLILNPPPRRGRSGRFVYCPRHPETVTRRIRMYQHMTEGLEARDRRREAERKARPPVASASPVEITMADGSKVPWSRENLGRRLDEIKPGQDESCSNFGAQVSSTEGEAA